MRDNDWTGAAKRIDAEYRPFLQKAKEQGWTIDSGRKTTGHPVLYPKDRQHHPIPVPTTPRKGRTHALRNFRQQLRRAGLVL